MPGAPAKRAPQHVALRASDFDVAAKRSRFVIASRQADLDAKVPSGPRMTARRTPGVAPSVGDLMVGAKQPFVGDVKPDQTTVDGKSAVSVEWTEATSGVKHTTRLIMVRLVDGAFTFTLEAPQADWDNNRQTFEGIVASVKFA